MISTASTAFLPARPVTPADLLALTERVRMRLVRWFLRHGLLDAAAAADMLAWQNSGFSIDASVRIALVDRDVPCYSRSLCLAGLRDRAAFTGSTPRRRPRTSAVSGSRPYANHTSTCRLFIQLLISALALLLRGSASLAAEPTPNELFSQAVELFFAAKPAESARVFDQLVVAVPAAEPELWQRGLALYCAERYQGGTARRPSRSAIRACSAWPRSN